MRTLAFRSLILLAAVMLTTSCDGARVGRANARTYFNEHRAAFERVVAQAELCQPPMGKIERNGAIQCTNSRGDPNGLRAAMSAADTQWIYVFTERGAPSLSGVDIVVYSYGVAFAGEVEEFRYRASAAAHAEYQMTDYGNGATTEMEPVTDPPHHWYWRKLER